MSHSESSPRIDLYTSIHKGIRALLFETASAAARLDPARDDEVDVLVASVERLLGFLDEHAEHEDNLVMPALRKVAPSLASRLAGEHVALDELQVDVGLAADAMALADADDRAPFAAALCRALNQLVAAHLGHMHREETEANAALWAAYTDDDLLAIQLRIVAGVAPPRMAQWMTFVLPALSPGERAAMEGAH